MRRILLAVLLPLLGNAALGQEPSPSPAGAPAKPPKVGANVTFEALMADFRKGANADETLADIKQWRIERNIRSLEEVALAFVARGVEALNKGEADAAREEFRRAISLDPNLPDAYLGLARAEMKAGSFVSAVRDTLAALSARLSSWRGRFYFHALMTSVFLLASLAGAFALAVGLLLRHGTLLLHDLEESYGSSMGRPFALGVFVLLLLLPLVLLQGWGWLSLWWLAVVFVYATTLERIVSVIAVATSLLAGPLVASLQQQAVAYRNPLLEAAMRAAEGGPDADATARLQAAAAANPEDRDLKYLLARLLKKAGRYDEAEAVYRRLLEADKSEFVALNNLANIRFAQLDFAKAAELYGQGKEQAPRELRATFYHNLRLTQLRRFDFPGAEESRAQAEKVAGSLVREHEYWKYDTGDYAVVDASLDVDHVWVKFAGKAEGIARQNVAGSLSAAASTLPASLLNRMTAFLAVFGLVVAGISRIRGSRMFTMRCVKCGTPFCKLCHLGAAPQGLCTQCYHLFVVRDGVSGPARNRKLAEVQEEEERRRKLFRLLSVLSPGTGHVYAQKTVLGLVLIVIWYLVIAAAVVATLHNLPFTEASAVLVSPAWGLGLAAGALLVLWIVANRIGADFEAPALAPRRAGGGAGTTRRRPERERV